ncbi:MAG TPA: PHB depolymerase family esterase [Gammaproteobacteria bacterium]|nr:PHB depolymerase family esterase [Gammaproteobacteria bacterium]
MKSALIRTLALAFLALTGASRAADTQDQAHKLDFGGLDRSYLLHLPANSPPGPLALVVVLHGGAGSGAGAAKMTGFDAVADEQGFIVVYPDGTDRARPLREAMGKPGFLTWDAGSCCGYAQAHNMDDVGFIRAVVADVEKAHAVDPKRVYATGISNGGMLSYRIACEASDVFAAIAPVAGIIEIPDCKPTHRVAIIDLQGTDDENVPLNGGIGKKEVGKKEYRKPVQDSIDFWVKEDGCSVKVNADAPDLHMVDNGGCQDGTDVNYYIVQGGGHAWPGGQQMASFLDKPDPKVPATDIIWDFFKDHPKP